MQLHKSLSFIPTLPFLYLSLILSALYWLAQLQYIHVCIHSLHHVTCIVIHCVFALWIFARLLTSVSCVCAQEFTVTRRYTVCNVLWVFFHILFIKSAPSSWNIPSTKPKIGCLCQFPNRNVGQTRFYLSISCNSNFWKTKWRVAQMHPNPL